ncbi:glycoside hydrolase, family 43 [Labilithrix luteola]|uniref:Glycoside hydrolase, family 43 n=1 Tax=Labilithrix luteola TaxID=1391654 RepID=A0A0K1Q8E0_9BACT|nr:glycoside hydrolase family 43 protein [Labilithrix luteola]AKV02008.1 glycoside hydrolase, family 43 [Labilithrix luteola]
MRTLSIALLAVVATSTGCTTGSSAKARADRPDATVPDGTSPMRDAGHLGDAAPTPTDAGAATPRTYTNPVFAGDFADPFILRVGETFYAYATNNASKNVQAAVSTDLASWTELADALPALPAWAKANASLTWAPSVLARGSRYVLYYTARSTASGFQCIGRAMADRPEGPFVDESDAPLICQVAGEQAMCGSIDPSPFVDDDGNAFLLWKSDENAEPCRADARLWSQKLAADGLRLEGLPSALLRRDKTWEQPLIEGPSMAKHDGKYYLFYSANWWESPNYAVGYATCSGPVGPCEKQSLDAPLVASRDGALGPGGQEFFTDTSGTLWMAYHGWSSPIVGYSNGGARALRIDPISFAGGVPTLAGPTTTPQVIRATKGS